MADALAGLDNARMRSSRKNGDSTQFPLTHELKRKGAVFGLLAAS
jgi:hypothetical protein